MQRVLVLNSSYEFLGFCSWQNAICAKVTGKVYIEEEYDDVVRSPSVTMRVPAVIRLRHYVKVAYDRIMFVSYTKRNVHLRDNYVCQYCNTKCDKRKLGIDHVIPESKGGLTTWENTVSCCHGCNLVKDDRTPEEAGLHLIRIPHKPKCFVEVIRIKVGEVHDKWRRYLGLENE